MELLLKNTDPALVQFEMDVGWVVAAGADPFVLMKAHKGRFTQMHVKDVKATTKPNFAFQQDPTEVGSGTIPWPRLLPAAETTSSLAPAPSAAPDAVATNATSSVSPKAE